MKQDHSGEWILKNAFQNSTTLYIFVVIACAVPVSNSL
jgi:hypothetical protein